MRCILASASPSRAAILRAAGVEPLCHPAHIDEETIAAALVGKPPEKVVAALAQEKAEAVARLYPADIVIGADSMLFRNGRLEGKPHTIEETIRRWSQQRGTRATLMTGHCVCTPRGSVTETSSTIISFADVNDTDVAAYAHSEEPLECAGAFTLEQRGGWFIDRIEGDPSGVIGLSLPAVRRALYSLGYNVHEVWASSTL